MSNPIKSGCAGALVAVACLLPSGCVTGPDYERPSAEVPADWRWKQAEPGDAVPRGAWWSVFKDPRLDALEQQAVENNQDLKAAIARFDEARAISQVKRTEYFPNANASAGYSANRYSGAAPSPIGPPIPAFITREWQVPFDLSYEIDLWGKVRRGFESTRATASARAAAYENLMLSITADVAVNYFALGRLEGEIKTLQDAIDLRREALTIFEQRLTAGVGTDFEVERTKVELATSQADLVATQRQKAELINALALLCGTAPVTFELASANLPLAVPQVGAGLPSSLLERRPDVAEAERTIMARNAEIGVAKAAYYPTVKLTATAGFRAEELSDIFDTPAGFWGVNPSISYPLFRYNRIGYDVERAQALFAEAVANYRQSLLKAFRDVDDSLAAIQFLQQEETARIAARQAARNSSRISLDRFQAGTVNFLEVIDAETARLNNELAVIRVTAERFAATVRLIKALGGGWEESEVKEVAP